MGLSWLMGRVMEAKGRQDLFEHQRPEVLATLRQIAIIQSTESSNRIEGVTVAPDRLVPLVLGKTGPRDRSEDEIVGYREALALIHDGHGDLPVAPATFRELHRRAQAASGDGGEYKRVDNDIIEVQPDGRRTVRFRTVRAADVPDQIEQLCLAYDDTIRQGQLPPLLAVANLTFDFLCIHPFRDGNGRVSRLITLLALYHHGYEVGRYVSLERIIEASRDGYYDALGRSSQRWHEGEHDLVPWWTYLLSTLRQAYDEMERRAQEFGGQRGAKTETIEAIVDRMPRSFQIADVAREAPNVSRTHIRNVLRGLRDDGKLAVQGHGRGARWVKQ